MTIDTVELFNTNQDFRDYVEKYIFKHHITLAEALKHALVINYGIYVCERGKENENCISREREYGEDKSC